MLRPWEGVGDASNVTHDTLEVILWLSPAGATGVAAGVWRNKVFEVY